jgi:4'-phosphopantetheinyl transferase
MDAWSRLRRLPSIALPAGAVHVWLNYTQALTPDAVARLSAAILEPEERARCARLLRPRQQHEHTLARLGLRHVLSRYAPVHPRDWRFTANAYGRPAIAAPAQHADLHFNLSHTAGLTAYAVTRGDAVGIDVEDLTRDPHTDLQTLADRWYAPPEAAALARVPVAQHAQRFLEYWTLKEAYIKARGIGLSLALDSFAMELTLGVPIKLRRLLHDAADTLDWRFLLALVDERYPLAVALGSSGNHRPWQLQLRQLLPLTAERHLDSAMLATAWDYQSPLPAVARTILD